MFLHYDQRELALILQNININIINTSNCFVFDWNNLGNAYLHLFYEWEVL